MKTKYLLKYPLSLAICMFMILLAACSIKKINDQAKLLDNRSTIHGSVSVSVSQNKPVYAVLYRIREHYIELNNKSVLTSNNKYRFDVLPGNYMIGAFVDNNNDAKWQYNEFATYLGMENTRPSSIEVVENQSIEIGNIEIKGTVKANLGYEKRNILPLAMENIGRIVSLQNPMFTLENAAMGFWRPVDFAKQFGGGLMMLQKYESSKTPVIFIHGIFGTSLEFESMIAGLDRQKFQPWVLHYPSGVSLDMVSNYLLKSLNQLHVKYQFPRVNIVAHSMGGLMTRAFVMKHQANGGGFDLSFVMTINSPLYGMDNAAKGVKMSPIVIPAWRDVASNSEFIKKVHAWRWPTDTPYHLVFSYLPDEEGDGVVPMKSQLSLSLQDEATRVYGFQAQHAGILKAPEFITRFNKILAEY